MNKRLAIFGPYPPPLGGISVHVKRMEPYLIKNKIGYKIFNHGSVSNEFVVPTNKKMFWYIKLFFEKNFTLFHFHQFFYFHFFYYLIFSWVRKDKILVTIHSERILGYGLIKKRIAVFLLSKTRNISLISVSKNLNDYFKNNGIKSIFLPAYVPPQTSLKSKIDSESYSGHLFLFSVWKFDKKLANEVYNVPLIFEFLSKHKKDFTMLFMIGSKSNSDLKYLEVLLSKYGIHNNIKVLFNENLVDYIHNCKFLVRPNLHDGFGVSIQEALDLGVPAIASDVCQRPKGAILFNNSLEDLEDKIDLVLNTPVESILSKKETLSYHNQLINIYIDLLKEAKQ